MYLLDVCCSGSRQFQLSAIRATWSAQWLLSATRSFVCWMLFMLHSEACASSLLYGNIVQQCPTREGGWVSTVWHVSPFVAYHNNACRAQDTPCCWAVSRKFLRLQSRIQCSSCKSTLADRTSAKLTNLSTFKCIDDPGTGTNLLISQSVCVKSV